MELSNIAREIASLPPDAQKQVVDFLAFLIDAAQEVREAID